LCNTVLNYVDVVNDLGVLADPHLTFEAHSDNIVQKAARRSYLIFKLFQSRITEVLLRAFTTYRVAQKVSHYHMIKNRIKSY